MKPPIKDVPIELNRRLDALEGKTTGEVLVEVIKAVVPGGSRSSPGSAVPPPTVALEGVTYESISLSATPIGEDLYEFAVRMLGTEGWNTLVTTGETATFISLKAGTQYEARVRILNIGGSGGSWSDAIIIVTDEDRIPPPIPENLSLTADSFYMRAVVDNIDQGIHTDLAGYEFHASLSTGFTPDSTTLKQVGISNRCVIHVSGAGQTWYVVVRSFDTSRNYSEYCDEVSILIPSTKIPISPSDPTEEGSVNIVEGSLTIDNADTIGDWESEDVGAIRIEAADPTDVAEGTGAIKVEVDKYARKINQPTGVDIVAIGQYLFNEFVGQRFKSPWSGDCKRISVPLSPVGSPAAMTLHIYSDSGGNPNASLGSATLTAPAQTAWYTATFAAGITLVSGTAYWIIVDSVVSSSNYYVALYSQNNPYEGVDYMMGMGPTDAVAARYPTYDLTFRLFSDSESTGKHFKITSLAAKDLSTYDTLELYVKENQTITNGVFKVSMGEAALGEQLHTISAPGASYGTDVWDISGLTDADINAIVHFGIEVDVADDYTLELYFDYFRAVLAKKVNVKASDEVLQLYPALADVGEGNVFLHLAYYASIGQGTWVFIDTFSLHGRQFYNSTGADGDNITVTAFLAAGTYTIKVYGYRALNAAIVDIDIDGVEVMSFDMYGAAVRDYLWTDTGNVISDDGIKSIKVRVDGKNASSSSYVSGISGIMIYRTA